MDKEKIDEIVSKYTSASGKVLGVLKDTQNLQGYLSKEVLDYLSRKLEVPLSELYSIATFYSFFNLKAVGVHTITVCMGTACHVKGAPTILKALREMLEIEAGEVSADGRFQVTTVDGNFTLTSARCFGACSMAPVIRIDGKVYGYVTPEALPSILKQYGWSGK